jgi:hypothetical protein
VKERQIPKSRAFLIQPLRVKILCYQAENHVITTNIESNFHEILFETTNIDLKGDKILNEIGKTLSLQSYCRRQK